MVNYRMTFDLHTHTVIRKIDGREILHASGTVEDNVLAALEKGLSCIGISNHGPGHITYGMPMDYVPTIRGEIEEARQRHPEIRILFGVEANIINPTGHLDVAESEFSRFDYIMAGYHYGIFGENPGRATLIHGANWMYENFEFVKTLYDGTFYKRWSGRRFEWGESGESCEEILLRVNTAMMTAAIYENRPKVITHPGDKGPFDIEEIAKACEITGTWMEINNFHRDLTVEGIRRAAKYDVRFVIGSDAHRAENVGGFELGLERALQAGLPIERIENIEMVRASGTGSRAGDRTAEQELGRGLKGESEPESKPEFEPVQEPEFEPGRGLEPEPDRWSKREPEPELDRKIEPGLKSEPGLDRGTKRESEFKLERKVESKPELEPVQEPEFEPGLGLEPELDRGTKRESESGWEPDRGPDRWSKREPESKTDWEAVRGVKPKPDIGPDGEPKPEPVQEAVREPKPKSELELVQGSEPEPNRVPERKPEPEFKSDWRPRMGSEADLGSKKEFQKGGKRFPVSQTFRQKNIGVIYRKRRGNRQIPPGTGQ